MKLTRNPTFFIDLLHFYFFFTYLPIRKGKVMLEMLSSLFKTYLDKLGTWVEFSSSAGFLKHSELKKKVEMNQY